MVTVIGELAGLAGLFLFAPAIWAGRALARRHSDIRWRLACWWADHKYAKLRATTSPACDVPEVALGSTVPIGEPQPASALHSDAGPNLQPLVTRLEGRRCGDYSEQPQPAPGRVRPGAGPTPPRTGLAAGQEEPRDTAVAVGDPDWDVDTPPTGIPVSASPHQRPAAAVFPDTAAAGLPPRPGATPGGAGPSVVAADGPVRGAA